MEISHSDYATKLSTVLNAEKWTGVQQLAEALDKARRERHQVFLCGNGGSAANAAHLANDFLSAIFKRTGKALRAHALSANPSILTCIANDIAYEEVFAEQLKVLANPGDLLIVFSGSGNSPNILRVLEEGQKLGVTSYAILGFDGGRALKLADVPIHFPVHDMQIAEDLQLICGHMIMKWLAAQEP